MRPVRRITVEEENFRTEQIPGTRLLTIKRDSIEPEPVGTIVLCAFRITGYDQGCDGSLMARLSQIDKDGDSTRWEQDSVGVYPETNIVCTLEEFQSLFPSPEAIDKE